MTKRKPSEPTTRPNGLMRPEGRPDEEKERVTGDDQNKQHKEDFEQLLDDAVFRVKSKNTRGYSDG